MQTQIKRSYYIKIKNPATKCYQRVDKTWDFCICYLEKLISLNGHALLVFTKWVQNKKTI